MQCVQCSASATCHSAQTTVLGIAIGDRARIGGATTARVVEAQSVTAVLLLVRAEVGRGFGGRGAAMVRGGGGEGAVRDL